MLRSLGDAPEEVATVLALVTQLLVEQVGPFVAVPQVAAHPVLAVRHRRTKRTSERRPCRLPVRLALVRVAAGEEVEALTADLARERLVPLLLAVRVLAAHVVRERQDGGQDN